MSKLIKPQKNYTTLGNSILDNPNASLRAVGLYARIARKPNNWNFSARRLSKETTEGYKTILNTLNELEILGYLFRKKLGNGKNDYYIFNSPEENYFINLMIEPESNMGTQDTDPESNMGTVPKRLSAEIGTINNTSLSNNTSLLTNGEADASPEKSFLDFFNEIDSEEKKTEYKTYLSYIKRGKRYLDKETIRLQVEEINKHSLDELKISVKQTIANGWRGLFWNYGNKGSPPKQKVSSSYLAEQNLSQYDF